MTIHDFKRGDIICITGHYSWIVRFDRIESNGLKIYDLSVAIEDSDKFSGRNWGNIELIKKCRYATPEEIEIFTKIEKERGIKIPINELYPIW